MPFAPKHSCVEIIIGLLFNASPEASEGTRFTCDVYTLLSLFLRFQQVLDYILQLLINLGQKIGC